MDTINTCFDCDGTHRGCECSTSCGCRSGNVDTCRCNSNSARVVLTSEDIIGLSKILTPKSNKGPTEDVNELEFSLLEVTKKAFAESYGYPHQNESTIPSDMSPGSTLKSIDDFVHVNVGNIERTTSTFRRVLRGRKLPEWVIDQVVADIADKAAGLFLDAIPGEWKETTFGGSYIGPNPNDGPIEARAAVLYISAALTEDGRKEQHLVISYVAVYYGPQGSI